MDSNLNCDSISLRDLACNQQVNSVDFQACWNLVIRGIESHMLNAEELEELINLLCKGWDYINDEIGFEFINQTLRISFLDEYTFCSPQEMIEQLETLLDRFVSVNR